MLTIFRRHTRKCRHTSRDERRCSCPIAVEGTLDGEYLRRSLGVRSWEAAQKKIREWETTGRKDPVKVSYACNSFLKDCEARRVGPAQLGKYKLLIKELKDVIGERNIAEVTLEDLRNYRALWRVSPVSAQKKLERLKTFFRFAHDSGWVSNNPARLLKPPKIKPKPTLPFSDQEMEKILWACEVYPDRPRGRREQIKAFVLLLRYSGLRIGDATSLTADKIQDGKLMLYTAKAGTAVWLPLPAEAIETLGRVGKAGCLFWSGNGILKSAIADWQRSLKRLFSLAGVKGHAHMFRDTFAVDLLKRGVSLENVAALLGNTPRIAEKHYSPWVKSRQENLEREVKKAWG